ncbi:MAG: protein kinase [Elusimicrobia bacterium]|nr:protein kinase [Elusimicrobiota bacterium]
MRLALLALLSLCVAAGLPSAGRAAPSPDAPGQAKKSENADKSQSPKKQEAQPSSASDPPPPAPTPAEETPPPPPAPPPDQGPEPAPAAVPAAAPPPAPTGGTAAPAAPTSADIMKMIRNAKTAMGSAGLPPEQAIFLDNLEKMMRSGNMNVDALLKDMPSGTPPGMGPLPGVSASHGGTGLSMPPAPPQGSSPLSIIQGQSGERSQAATPLLNGMAPKPMPGAGPGLSAEDPKLALLEASQRLEKNPDDFVARADRAEALNRLGDYAAAEAEATRALSLQPRLVKALNARAYAYNKRGQYSLALQDADMALSLDPKSALAHLNKAMALEGLGRVREALLEYEAASSLDPAFMPFYRDAVARHGVGAAPDRSQVQTLPPQSKSLFPLRDVLPAALLVIAALAAWKRFSPRPPAGQAAGAAPASAQAPAQAATGETPGVIAGTYRVNRKLAEGGMGVVYDGLDTALQRRVAIKRMRGDFPAGSGHAEAFLAEARLVASLKHPNIVEIYAVLQEQGVLYLVFEFVSGRPLDQLLASKKRLDLTEVLHLLGQIAAGLECAHGKNIIHRDLKPANVLITNEGGAKITDFGIAHRARMEDSRSTRTYAAGTPHYMPPEQETGTVSLESDTYALGVMAYELLTGALPFPGPDFTAQKLAMRMEPPTVRVPGLPPHVNTAISRALDPRPEARFRRASDLVRALNGEEGGLGACGLMIPSA